MSQVLHQVEHSAAQKAANQDQILTHAAQQNRLVEEDRRGLALGYYQLEQVIQFSMIQRNPDPNSNEITIVRYTHTHSGTQKSTVRHLFLTICFSLSLTACVSPAVLVSHYARVCTSLSASHCIVMPLCLTVSHHTGCVCFTVWISLCHCAVLPLCLAVLACFSHRLCLTVLHCTVRLRSVNVWKQHSRCAMQSPST